MKKKAANVLKEGRPRKMRKCRRAVRQDSTAAVARQEVKRKQP